MAAVIPQQVQSTDLDIKNYLPYLLSDFLPGTQADYTV